MRHHIRSLIGGGLAGVAIIAAGLAGGVAHAQDKAPIKAATLLDFTRVYTFLTDEYSQGQQDYIKLLNLEGGIDGFPVEMIVRDQGSQPQQGIALYNQARDEGAIFFDFLSTPVANAVMPRANEDHLPMIAFAHGRADAIDGERFPFVFPAAAIYRSQAALLAKYMKDHEGGLEGKKVAFVHIDSPFGREPVALLEALTKTEKFTLKTFPYAVPGTEQSATWTDVRRFQPDKVIIWGAGPGQAVSIRGAIANGISPKIIHSVIWLSETDMRSFQGDAVVGVKRFTAVNTGADSAILKRISEKVVAAGHGTGDAKVVGSTYYNIGVASMAIMAQAAKLGIEKLGPPLTGDKLKAGFEMIKDFDAEGLMPPLTITPQDHQGGGWGRVSEWDGDKWVPLSDWDHAYQDVVWQLVRDDAANAAKEAKKVSLLSLNNVEVAYDKVFLAIRGVSLDVEEGSMVAILGANGAGKSTTLKTISGLLAPERGAVRRGQVTFQGQDIGHHSPPQRVSMGLVHVLEGRRIFEHLTPDDNLLAAYPGRRAKTRYSVLREQAYDYFPRLAERSRTKAGYLSGGEQQMLAIARALMTEPQLLMLDEPSLGLAPVLVKEIFSIIRKISQEQGTSVLLVEQNARAALDIVDHAYLLENGNVVMSGSAEALKQNPDVQEFYLGGGGKVDYHNVKHYRRRKRWLA